MYRLQIQKLALEIEEHYSDYDRCIALLQQAIQIADKHNDLDWGVDLRSYLIRKESATSMCIHSPAAFAWILNVCDEYPEEFSDAEFLGLYEWMLGAVNCNTDIPLEHTHTVALDLERRLEKNGMSKRGLYFCLAEFAQNRGDVAKGCEYIDLAKLESKEDDEDEVVEYDYSVERASIIGDFEEAIYLANQMELKKLSAFSLPFESYCAMTYFMARRGDGRASIYLEKAKEAFYKVEGVNSSMLFSMTRFIYTLHLLEDELLYSMFELVVDWQVGAEDFLQMAFSQHIAAVFVKGGTRELKISPKQPYYKQEGIYDLAVLAAYYYSIAESFSTKFDQRNGNNHCCTELKQLQEENQPKK